MATQTEGDTPALGFPAGLEGPYRTLLSAVQADSTPGIIFLRGAPGLGKSSLISRLAQEADQFGHTPHLANGVEREWLLPFWGLHQLISRLIAGPSAKSLRDLLTTAMTSPVSIERQMNLTRLTLELVQDQPGHTTFLIDNAEFIDRPTLDVLVFVATKLRVGFTLVLVYSERVPQWLYKAKSAEVTVKPLESGAAEELVRSNFPQLPSFLVARVTDSADGVPVALLEYARALTPEQIDGSVVVKLIMPMNNRLLDLYRSRVERLPREIRRQLLRGAIDQGPKGIHDPGLGGWHPNDDELSIVENAGLASKRRSASVSYTTLLVRSTVYNLASPGEVREAFQSLADQYADGDPTRSAIQRAGAMDGPNEQVASDLADVARLRADSGLHASALGLLLHACLITPVPAVRAERLREAAAMAVSYGQTGVARKIVADADEITMQVAAPLHEAIVLSSIQWQVDGDFRGAFETVRKALNEPGNPPSVDIDEALLVLTSLASLLDSDDLWRQVADAQDEHAAHLSDLTELVLMTQIPTSLRPLEGTVEDRVRAVGSDVVRSQWDATTASRFGQAVLGAEMTAGFTSLFEQLAERTAHEGSYLGSLDAQLLLALDLYRAGRWDESERLAQDGLDESLNGSADLAGMRFRVVLARIAAARGDAGSVRVLCEEIERWARPRGVTACLVTAMEAQLLLHISRADFEAAAAVADKLLRNGTLPLWPYGGSRALLDVVVAFERSGQSAKARAIAEAHHLAMSDRFPSRIAVLDDVARALTVEDESGALFRQVLSNPTLADFPFDQARVHLLYGERLRRRADATSAGAHLVRAHDLFRALGATAWSDHASTELRAIGANPSGFTSTGVDDGPETLTAQEAQIASLAASGMSNRAIATRLFLSPRTVSGHLYNAFPKLRVTSRAGLRDALDALPPHE